MTVRIQNQHQQPSAKILFLTVNPFDPAEPTKSGVSGPSLAPLLRAQGAKVDIKRWTDTDLNLDPHTTDYTCIMFLWCENYISVASKFGQWVKENILPIKRYNTTLLHSTASDDLSNSTSTSTSTSVPKRHAIKLMNDPSLILWNIDKQYLKDLSSANFLVPTTTYINISQTSLPSLLGTHISNYYTGPLVVKPSISASGKGTYLIKDCQNLVQDDTDFLKNIYNNNNSNNNNKDTVLTYTGSLMLQEYLPAIKKGEYSLVYINSQLSHAVLKVPGDDDFRVHGRYGGSSHFAERASIPPDAEKTAERLIQWLKQRFVDEYVGVDEETGEEIKGGLIDVDYVRVDGVVRDDGRFVLIEVEAFEPHMWLGEDNMGFDTREGTERFCKWVMAEVSV